MSNTVIFTALVYLVFAGAVVGVTGDITTPEALAGLAGILGHGIVILGSLFGIMTIATSFVMMSTGLYETFRVDYHVSAIGSWLLVLLPPLLFFMSGLRNFIDVIGLVGSVSVGLLGVIVLAAWVKARRAPLRTPEWRLRIPTVLVWLVSATFAGGVIYALFVQ